ncbi:MAG: Asp-tRNA(Asn)/Glu-tRNA(Gln) amidotransferase subunit GatA [Cyclobacteriaceae bacterium]|nr:Asp-tRNA(Asn)/Glu-tRNA(Gln) amidotransferase subunit GatA [Cytophagales bacterium]MBX2901139.1 Asp-tRNA(Asn)/Glu-tRNA(Gln) amidotransferase subunit GatA [Cyclobacteriaceae bacterium]
MSGTELTDLQHQLHHGTLTCVARVEQFLATIESKKHLNAYLSVYGNEALERARVIDTKIKARTAGKLAGLVVGLKDVLAYQNHPLQASSKILDGFVSEFTATAVERLLKEDAIIIGRQNCDEFAMGSSNENSAFGAVLNEIDTTRVPGGSSGGSAVAVMADTCDVALGSDTGGSVRQPAAFCGIYGLKPTYSRISRYGLVAYGSSFDCIGIFSKNLKTLTHVLEVIAGADEFDSTVSHQPVPAYAQAIEQPAGPFKIAYLNEALHSQAVQPEIRQALKTKVEQLQHAGHTVTGIDFPLSEYILPTYYILATAEASSNLSRYDGVRYGYRSPHTTDLQSMYKKTRSEGFGKEVQRRILLGTFVLSASYYDAYYTKAQKVRQLIRQQTQKIFSHYDFILSPTTPTTAFKIGTHSNNPVEMYLADLFSVHANVAGVPAISVPCGTDAQGLPIGLQLTANDFNEAGLFQVSKVIQNLAG